jgi:hypothetical protein
MLVGLNRWNWDGDRIIHRCIVPSSRPVVGSRSTTSYDIDVREFLVTERNEVMRRTLEREVRRFIQEELEGASWERLTSRAPGSFDHRAEVLAAFVSAKVRYDRKDPRDPWQFPDETLSLLAGDCEDRAFLLASLLLASGISGYNVRVALGAVRVYEGEQSKDHHHVWVMYKGEDGRWRVLEPLAETDESREAPAVSGPAASPRAEYRPYYVFNDAHLWEVLDREPKPSFQAIAETREWSKLDPHFAGLVHRTILNLALNDVSPRWVRQSLNRNFTAVLGRLDWTLDKFDQNIHSYDPRHHFDCGLIQEGWDFVRERLERFRQHRHLDDFAQAAHSIADFYAHSSYVHFAKLEGGQPVLYDPDNEAAVLDRVPDYSTGPFNLGHGSGFSVNERYWRDAGRDRIPVLWKGKIISGRYALPGDGMGGLGETLTNFPDGRLSQAELFSSLPHHEEIAVDGEAQGEHQRLYSGDAYKVQFERRKDAAVRHIRKAFVENWSGQ